MSCKRIISALFLLLCITLVHAQEEQVTPQHPLFIATEIEVGGVDLLDTYLSPWSYSGWNIGVNVELMKTLKGNSKQWVWQQLINANYGQSRMNISGAGLTESGGGNYSFAMMHQSNTPLKGLHLYYGASIGIGVEVLYNYHGGNNPTLVKADGSLALTGMIVYNFAWGKQPFTVRYQPILPIVGVFAQPEYAESYYEIWLGNYNNFIHCGTWGNRFDMDNRISIDIHFSNWALRIGYHNSIHTTFVNNNRYQMIQNNFTIGFAGDIISLGKNNNTTIRALYNLP